MKTVVECRRSRSTARLGTFSLALLAALTFRGELLAQAQFASTDAADVTFAADVAPIIYQNCSVCHRPGGIAPMNLMSYDDARRYSRRIREQVSNRLMPPYSYDRHVGIQQLQHDWRLSQEDINTVVAWVDAGAPEGNPDVAPAPPEFPNEAGWNFESEFGPPDLIIPSEPIDVPAGGNDMWFQPYSDTGLTEDRCIRAMQVRPAGEAASVVHHANSYFEEPQADGSFQRTGSVTEYAMGKVGEIVPEGVCRRASATAKIAWDIHLYPGGIGATAPGTVIEDNVVELGIWLHQSD
jgi:mono/diheme cytochrome c family protein